MDIIIVIIDKNRRHKERRCTIPLGIDRPTKRV